MNPRNHLFMGCLLVISSAAQAASLLFNFEDENAGGAWRIVNDGVMGGRSTSRVFVGENHTLLFSGHLSLENNGGFVSTRRDVDKTIDPSARGFVIRTRGDGRTYQLRVRTNQQFDGIAYAYSFETSSDEWQELRIRLDDMRATWRGRAVPDAPALKAEDIRQLGFLLGDKQAGNFELEIAWIKIF